MRTHFGDRPYACTTCGMAFSRSDNLPRHCTLTMSEGIGLPTTPLRGPTLEITF